MSKKFCRNISLALAVFLMAASLGACKKNDSSPTSNTDTKITSSTSKTTNRTSVTVSASNSKTASDASTSDPNIHTGTNSDPLKHDTGSYDSGSTSNAEMEQLLDTKPMEAVPITPVDQNMDLGGRTIKIIYDTNINSSPGDPPTNLELAQNPKSIVRFNIIEDAKSKMNFNIDWIYRSHDNMVYEYMDATAAGTEYADILLSSTKRVFPQLAVKKLLVPIDNFIDFNNDPLYNTGTMSSGTEFLGRRWGFSSNPYGVGYVFFYNRDILAKEGLTDIQQVYKQGNWTWETMVDYAKAATHDFNGDGAVDQWGILLSNLHMAAQALILSNGGDMIRYDSTENTYRFAANEIKSARALQLINDLVGSKVTTPDSSVKFDKFPSAMVLGKIISDGIAYKKLGMNYGIAPLPKGPDVSETQFANGSGVNAYFIPVNTDPKVAAAVIKEAFTYWNTNKSEYMTKSDVLDTEFQEYLSTNEDVKWTVENFAPPRVSQVFAFNSMFSNFNSNVVLKVAWNESTPAAALQAQAGALQNDMESALR